MRPRGLARILLAALLAAGAADRAGAQARAAREAPGPWTFGRGPAVAVGGQFDLGVGLGAGFDRQAPPGLPYATAAEARARFRLGLSGSRDLALTFAAPGLADDWRVYLTARLERRTRMPWFGATNAERESGALTGPYGSLYYRYALARATVFATAQRRLAGPLWLTAGGEWRRYRAASLDQSPTLHALEAAAASRPDTTRSRGVEARAGLVYDTRDDWTTPGRGVFLASVAAAGRFDDRTGGGRLGYRRWMLAARAYRTLDDSGRTVLALRQKVSLASATLPPPLAYQQVSAWQPEDGVFADGGIRLHAIGNQLASSHAVLSVDLRRKLLLPGDDAERPARLWGVVLADAGLLWEPGRSATSRRAAWTLGAGLRAQIGRAFMGGGDVGVTDAGPGLAITGGFGF